MVAQQPYHHGALREALLAAGRELLTERGPDSFSLSELARRVGVSTAAPYRHFADRDAIIDALADEGYITFGAALREAVDGAADPGDAVARIGVAYLRFAVEHPAVFAIMFRDREGRPAEYGPPSFQTFYEAVVRAQAEGYLADRLPAHAVARSIWATLHGTAVLDAVGGFTKLDIGAPLEELAADALDAYWVRPRPGG